MKPPLAFKVCSHCKQTKPAGDYHTRGKKNLYLQSACKPCQRKRERERLDRIKTDPYQFFRHRSRLSEYNKRYKAKRYIALETRLSAIMALI